MLLGESGVPTPLKFTQEKKHDIGGGENHEKIDSAFENQMGISDFGCVTCLMLKADAELGFNGDKPNHQTRLIQASHSDSLGRAHQGSRFCQSPAQTDAPYSPSSEK